MVQSSDAQQSRKRKWPCVECGNLFPTQPALKRHILLKESTTKSAELLGVGPGSAA